MTMPGEVSQVPVEPEPSRVASLDDFARITARLDGGADLNEVLAAEGITPMEWLTMQQEWLSRMASLACHGRRQLHERYLERLACFAGAAAAPSPDEGGDLPHIPAPRIVVARAQLAPSQRPQAPRIGTELPSPLVPPSPPTPPAPPQPSRRPAARTLFDTTLDTPLADIEGGAVPFKKVATGLPFAAAERAGRTVPRDLPPVLPFQTLADESPDQSGGTLDNEPVGSWDGTMTLDGSEPSPALPFDTDARATFTNEAPRAEEGWPFPRAERAADDETQGGDPYAGLPFRRSELPPVPPLASSRSPGSPHAAPESTEAERMQHLKPQLFSAVAPNPSPSASTPQITLEQYAWLTSLLARLPERENETLAWFQLSAERKVALDAYFAALFQREPAEHSRYQQLRAHYDSNA